MKGSVLWWDGGNCGALVSRRGESLGKVQGVQGFNYLHPGFINGEI
jgi:hypothetical protein